MNASKDYTKHPCFNKESSGSCGRVHLPVAPKCNIMCNYCNRKYDCVNESRPGVASAVLAPAQALRYLDEVLEREPRITVVGIAGPGDPFANATETLHTLRLIKEKHPQLLFCLSTNGLNLPPHVEELARLGVSHVTVTVNAVDPEIGSRIYSWVRDGKVLYRNGKGAELLLSRQLESIRLLKAAGITVKVNTIVIPGVNDHHVLEVARAVKELGADLHNLIPMHPNADTPFAEVPEPSKEMIHELRAQAGEFLPQMTHCRRCRADAVGLLCQDRSRELAPTLKACSQMVLGLNETRPFVAVATREGMLVNQHLGEATRFQIWSQEGEGFRTVDERPAPPAGNGPKRWEALAQTLKDCRAVLVSAAGETPRMLMEEHGVPVHDCSGFIEAALAVVYGAGDLSALRGRKRGIGGSCCSGGGKSCM
jgi:nitrogen fixation protein NifB